MHTISDPDKPKTIPFGMHQHKPLPDVPTHYLLWLLRATKLSAPLRTAVTEELRAREVEVPDQPQRPIPPCDGCGASDPSFSWQTGQSGVRLIRVDCKGCGVFQRFAPQVEPYLSLADAVAVVGASTGGAA